MNSTELFKVIGLDLASLGIVLMPVGWTATVIEGHIEFVIKVVVGITAAIMNYYVIRNARKKRKP